MLLPHVNAVCEFLAVMETNISNNISIILKNLEPDPAENTGASTGGGTSKCGDLQIKNCVYSLSRNYRNLKLGWKQTGIEKGRVGTHPPITVNHIFARSEV